MEAESITNGQFNQSCPCNNVSIKTPRDKVGGVSRLESFQVGELVETGESGLLRENTEAPHPFPVSCPTHCFHLAAPEISFYNKPGIY